MEQHLSTEEIVEAFTALRDANRRGVALEVEPSGTLVTHCDSPEDLTDSLRERLRASKKALLVLLGEDGERLLREAIEEGALRLELHQKEAETLVQGADEARRRGHEPSVEALKVLADVQEAFPGAYLSAIRPPDPVEGLEGLEGMDPPQGGMEEEPEAPLGGLEEEERERPKGGLEEGEERPQGGLEPIREEDLPRLGIGEREAMAPGRGEEMLPDVEMVTTLEPGLEPSHQEESCRCEWYQPLSIDDRGCRRSLYERCPYQSRAPSSPEERKELDDRKADIRSSLALAWEAGLRGEALAASLEGLAVVEARSNAKELSEQREVA